MYRSLGTSKISVAKTEWAAGINGHMLRMQNGALIMLEKYLSRNATKIYAKLLLERYQSLMAFSVSTLTSQNSSADLCDLTLFEDDVGRVVDGPVGCSTGWEVWSPGTDLLHAHGGVRFAYSLSLDWPAGLGARRTQCLVGF